MANELIVLVVRKYQETEKAILVGASGLRPGDDGKEWIPLSMVSHCKEIPGNLIELEIPRWMADRKDLLQYEKP